MKILLVQGSMHATSATGALLQELSRKILWRGAKVDLLDLGADPLPLMVPGQSHKAPYFIPLQKRVVESDAIVLGSPDYHGAPTGVLKNFLDHFWKEFAGKLFGYVCPSYEKGLTAMDMMRVSVRQCYGWSLPYGVSAVEKQDVSPEGKILSEALDKRLDMMAHDLVAYGTLIAEQRQKDLGAAQSGFMTAYKG
ncbi:MAG: NADPH-dependent FMN reductase [Planctomycetota bacterium]